jgi:hypothetical protein
MSVLQGYQGTYRLTPDFGHYLHCNMDIVRYRDWLAGGLPNRVPYAGVKNGQCAIKVLYIHGSVH